MNKAIKILIMFKDLIKVLLETRSIRKLINFMYRDQGTIILKKDVFDIIKTKNGIFYYVQENIDSVWGIGKDYDIDQISKENIVVDLGSCIGAFTLPVALRAKKVYAIEPLLAEELIHNIKLNKFTNVEVFKVGIGKKECQEILAFGRRSEEVSIMPFAKLRKKIGNIDYIKIDIEGWEWEGIQPRDLEGIKRIAFEPHIRLRYKKRDYQILQKWIKWLESEGYDYKLNWVSKGYPLGPFWACGVLHAKKRNSK